MLFFTRINLIYNEFTDIANIFPNLYQNLHIRNELQAIEAINCFFHSLTVTDKRYFSVTKL